MPIHPCLKILPDRPFIEIDGDALFLGRDCQLASRIPALKKKVVSNRQCCVKRESDGRWMRVGGPSNRQSVVGSHKQQHHLRAPRREQTIRVEHAITQDGRSRRSSHGVGQIVVPARDVINRVLAAPGDVALKPDELGREPGQV